jgi:hypothetical protein
LHNSDINTLTAKGVVYLDQAYYTEIIKYYDKGDFDRSTYRDLFEITLTFFYRLLKGSDTIIRVALCLFQILVFNSGVFNSGVINNE